MRLVAAFRDGSLDVTFIGITADRAEAIEFGPVVFEIQTTYLVPAVSAIASIAEIDRAGVRIAVPAKSAQEAHLTKTLTAATLIPVPAGAAAAAIDLLQAGEADAFSHVAPMLAAVQGDLPGARLLPGSYFNVPIAIGVAKGRPPAVADFARTFVAQAKGSGLLLQTLARNAVTGITVGAVAAQQPAETKVPAGTICSSAQEAQSWRGFAALLEQSSAGGRRTVRLISPRSLAH